MAPTLQRFRPHGSDLMLVKSLLDQFYPTEHQNFSHPLLGTKSALVLCSVRDVKVRIYLTQTVCSTFSQILYHEKRTNP